MGNACQCFQQTTKDKNIIIQIDNPKELTSESASNNNRESKADTSLNIHHVLTGGEKPIQK